MPETIRHNRLGYFMNGIYLLLGSNLDDRLANFRSALYVLAQKGVKMVRHAPIYETAPWGITDQPYFLNTVIEVQTGASPRELLQCCLDTEKSLGRVRGEKWGARIIDIDILFYHEHVIHEADFIVPHPGIADRRFTLLPLNDLLPDEIHPISKQTIRDMLNQLPQDDSCHQTDLALVP